MSETQARQLLAGLGVDSLLVTAPPNVRYLSNFSTPADGRVLVTTNGSLLITDGRYDAQAAEESTIPVAITREWQALVAERAAGLRLGVEADALTLAQYQDLQAGFDGELVTVRQLLRAERMVKDDAAQASLREAARITDAAFGRARQVIRAGMSEVEVALEIEAHMRKAGAEALSFDTVVASGPRSAMAHGVATGRIIEEGDIVTLDFGAVYEGYHADMTRTVAVGDPGEEMTRVYHAVLEAQLRALDVIRAGVNARDVDAAARTVLEGHGLAEYFVHSLGHGVGLVIHEGPTLSPRSEDVLEPGMAVTVEPGVYLPGTGGVRIEELVIVTESGYELLSHSPKELLRL